MKRQTATVDGWTLVHALTGVVAARRRVGFERLLLGGIAYEIAEQYLERTKLGQELFETSGPEVAANAVADVLVMMLAYRLAGGRRTR